jgi:[ribosomal protein S5]-alanine N-acetyltransferase
LDKWTRALYLREALVMEPALDRPRGDLPLRDVAIARGTAARPRGTNAAWQRDLPVLRGARVTLRELRVSDASWLFAMLSTEEVSRFISSPPSTVQGFERFVTWSHTMRRAGTHACFAVVPTGLAAAVGVIQLRLLETGPRTAEWGFAIGSSYWGTGLFVDAAAEVLAFAFDTLGVRRLEARASTGNERGNGALAKIGATKERVLRRSFVKDGQDHDEALWVLRACK